MLCTHLCSCSSFFIKKKKKEERKKVTHTSLLPNLCLGFWFLKTWSHLRRHQDYWEDSQEIGGGGDQEGQGPVIILPCVLMKGSESSQNLHLQRKMQGRAGFLHPEPAFNNIFLTTGISSSNSWFNYSEGQLSWRLSLKKFILFPLGKEQMHQKYSRWFLCFNLVFQALCNSCSSIPHLLNLKK